MNGQPNPPLSVPEKFSRLRSWRERNKIQLNDGILQRIAALPNPTAEAIGDLLPWLRSRIPEMLSEMTGTAMPPPQAAPQAQPSPQPPAVRPDPAPPAAPQVPAQLAGWPAPTSHAAPPLAAHSVGPAPARPAQPPAQQPASPPPVAPVSPTPPAQASYYQPAAYQPAANPMPASPLPGGPGVIASLANFEELMSELMRFAPYDFSGAASQPKPLSFRKTETGALGLSWPAQEDPHSLYRLVSHDYQTPTNPDEADQVALLSGTQFSDDRPVTTSLRSYQVWRNHGATLDQARNSQPVLHAAGVYVAAPNAVEWICEGSSVIGRWQVGGQTRRVLVFRIPKAQANPQALRDPSHQIQSDGNHLRGIVDNDVEPGGEYAYRVVAEVSTEGGVVLSQPAIKYLRVPAPLQPVTDLRSVSVATQTGLPLFDLTWTKPSVGNVVVFRTPHRPSDEARLRTYDEAALVQMGLGPDAALRQPVEDLADQEQILRGVPWPSVDGEEHSRLYLTPVTMLDGKVRVGQSVVQVAAGRIDNPVLTQRVNYQVLTFGWPARASIIRVYVTQPGVSAATAIETMNPVQSLSQQQYDIQGGVWLQDLPVKGCAIHAVPSTLDPAGEVLGEAASVLYPGLLQMRYQITAGRALSGLFRPAPLTISLSASFTVYNYQFRLVYRPDRLPLDANDGEAWYLSGVGEQRAPELQVTSPQIDPDGTGPLWQFDANKKVGWVRLFLVGVVSDGVARPLTALESQAIILTDPPVEQLRLRR